jgi:predicted GNAT family acetyltransferase
MNALQDEPGDGGQGRLSLKFDTGEVFADYRREGRALVIAHVEADPVLRNTGAAGRFMHGLADWARERGERLRPRCGYAVAWFARHPEAADVLDGDRPA